MELRTLFATSCTSKQLKQWVRVEIPSECLRSGRKFLIANAALPRTPIIFCNDDLCTLCGYSRAEVLQRSAALEFLYGPLTSSKAIGELRVTLSECEERLILAILYNKSGLHFVCQIAVAPVRNAEGQVRLYILTFRDATDFGGTKDSGYNTGTEVQNSTWASQLQRFLGLSRIITLIGRDVRHHHHSGRHDQVSSLPMTEESESDDQTPNPLIPISNDSTDQASLTLLTRNHSSGDLHAPDHAVEEKHGPVQQANTSSSHLDLMPVKCTSSVLLRPPEKSKKPRSIFPYKAHSMLVGSAVGDRMWTHRGGGIVINTELTGNSHRNVSDKVAEMLSLGPDVNPEQKLHAPRIYPFTLKHYGPVKAVWDWLVLVFVIYTAVFTPYAAAFLLQEAKLRRRYHDGWGRYGGLTPDHNPLQIIDLFVDVMFIIDIFINFRTTYVNKNDELVSHPCRIAIHYLKGWLLIDVVAAIPFDLLLFGAETDDMITLIGLLKTARLLRLVRVVRKLDRYSEYGAAVLLLLMATFVLIAHWLACIWYAVGNIERQQFNVRIGWLDQLAQTIKQPYGNRSNSGPSTKSKYITALYFTFSSLTSVGFGNVSPNTNPEKIFSICVMLVGSLMYAGIFGHVSAIIQRLYSGTARYHTQMLRVKEFIRFHQIPNPLKRRLEEFFQHAWSYTNGIDMNLVLRSFPECLQADICLHLNRHLLNTCPAFKGASQGCIRSLALKLKTTHVPPGDTLVHRGDVLYFICFIARGSIEILLDSDIVAVLCQGDVFGESPFGRNLMGQSKYYVRALTYCDLHRIQHEDLLEILEMYPEFAKEFKRELEITFDLRSSFGNENPEVPVPSDPDDALALVPASHGGAMPNSDYMSPQLPVQEPNPLSRSLPYIDGVAHDHYPFDHHRHSSIFQGHLPRLPYPSVCEMAMENSDQTRFNPTEHVPRYCFLSTDNSSPSYLCTSMTGHSGGFFPPVHPDGHTPVFSPTCSDDQQPQRNARPSNSSLVTILPDAFPMHNHSGRILGVNQECDESSPATGNRESNTVTSVVSGLFVRLVAMEESLSKLETRLDTDLARILSLVQSRQSACPSYCTRTVT
ncbi:unnamed protein product [Calicophoron daubneyi]|uniref:Cyclic nucleotide-binding domain-containing protein n=1 Tax=Calicophoron daubneyi TaxID=300641 RepID=A0AAV2TQ10_CALDB